MQVTVVTIAYNAGGGLARTAASVAAQRYAGLQWVVIDGGSSDGSLAGLEAYRARIAVLVSERDRGIADAMNKGLRLATGEAVLFLNAGDAFASPGSLATLVDAYRRSPDGWVVGGAEVRRESGEVLYARLPAPRRLVDLVRYGCRIAHAATLLSTRVLREAGGFSRAVRISMDYDLWIRLYRAGLRPTLCRRLVSVFFVGGASADIWRRWREDYLVRRRHGSLNPLAIELLLMGVAAAKHRAAGLRSFAPVYRLKERLRL